MEGVIHLDLQPQWITPFYSVDLQNSSHPTQSHSIIAKYTTAFLHSNWLYFLWHGIKIRMHQAFGQDLKSGRPKYAIGPAQIYNSYSNI